MTRVEKESRTTIASRALAVAPGTRRPRMRARYATAPWRRIDGLRCTRCRSALARRRPSCGHR